MNKLLSLLGVATICGAYASCTPNLMSDRSVKKAPYSNIDYNLVFNYDTATNYYIPYSSYSNYDGGSFSTFVNNNGLLMYGAELDCTDVVDEVNAHDVLNNTDYGYTSYIGGYGSDLYSFVLGVINDLPTDLVIFGNYYYFGYGGDFDDNIFTLKSYTLYSSGTDEYDSGFAYYRNIYTDELILFEFNELSDSYNVYMYYSHYYDNDLIYVLNTIYATNIYYGLSVSDYRFNSNMYGIWYRSNFISTFENFKYSGSSLTDSFNQGYQSGYQSGYENGVNSINTNELYQQGYNTGFTEAENIYKDNYDNAYLEGETTGYQNGYQDGYAEGVNEEFEFMAVFNKFFNLELFPGFRMYYILLVALGIGIFAIVMKMVFK